MARFRLLLAAVVVVLALPLSAGVASAAPANSSGVNAGSVRTQGADTITFLTFGGPADVFTFDVDLDSGQTGTTLTVATRDCCRIGDKWGVSISAPGFSRVASNCGTGSTKFFTGPASLGNAYRPVADTATVSVYYCSGTDDFAATMEVRFHYNGEGLTISGGQLG